MKLDPPPLLSSLPTTASNVIILKFLLKTETVLVFYKSRLSTTEVTQTQKSRGAGLSIIPPSNGIKKLVSFICSVSLDTVQLANNYRQKWRLFSSNTLSVSIRRNAGCNDVKTGLWFKYTQTLCFPLDFYSILYERLVYIVRVNQTVLGPS